MVNGEGRCEIYTHTHIYIYTHKYIYTSMYVFIHTHTHISHGELFSHEKEGNNAIYDNMDFEIVVLNETSDKEK